jgi:hypothetical protein
LLWVVLDLSTFAPIITIAIIVIADSLPVFPLHTVSAGSLGTLEDNVSAEARRRFGYRRLQILEREGWPVNHKRLYRGCM